MRTERARLSVGRVSQGSVAARRDGTLRRPILNSSRSPHGINTLPLQLPVSPRKSSPLQPGSAGSTWLACVSCCRPASPSAARELVYSTEHALYTGPCLPPLLLLLLFRMRNRVLPLSLSLSFPSSHSRSSSLLMQQQQEQQQQRRRQLLLSRTRSSFANRRVSVLLGT